MLIWAQQILLGTFIHASVVSSEIGWAIYVFHTYRDADGTTGLCPIFQQAGLFSGRSHTSRCKTEIGVHRPLRSKLGIGTSSLHPLLSAKASHKGIPGSRSTEIGSTA